MRCLLLPVLLLLVSPAGTVETRWPAYVLELPDSVDSIFIADTGAATIYGFEPAASGLVSSHRGYMSIGENGAGKERAWDRKTPLGIYFVVDQLDTQRLHEKYGVRAFPLDYPNTWDRRKKRSGDGIWVHGVAVTGERRPPRDTDGCLALPNEDLQALDGQLIPQATALIVTPEIEWRGAAERDALRKELKAAIRQWAAAVSGQDALAYVATYASTFRYRGMTFDEWAALRTQAIMRQDAVDVEIDELMLLADPVEEELYLARFRHKVTTDEGTTVVTKRLYWQRNADGNLRIVAEDNG